MLQIESGFVRKQYLGPLLTVSPQMTGGPGSSCRHVTWGQENAAKLTPCVQCLVMKAVVDGLFADVSVGCHPKPSSDGAGSHCPGLQNLVCDVAILALCGAWRAPRPGSGFHTFSGLKRCCNLTMTE